MRWIKNTHNPPYLKRITKANQLKWVKWRNLYEYNNNDIGILEMLTYHSLMWLAQWISNWNLIRNIWPMLVMIMQQKQTKQKKTITIDEWKIASELVAEKKHTTKSIFCIDKKERKKKPVDCHLCSIKEQYVIRFIGKGYETCTTLLLFILSISFYRIHLVISRFTLLQRIRYIKKKLSKNGSLSRSLQTQDALTKQCQNKKRTTW